jgi:hypothetical protein
MNYAVQYANGTVDTVVCRDPSLVNRLASIYGWGEGGVERVVPFNLAGFDLQASQLELPALCQN